MTMKDVNRFVIALIKHLDTLPADQVGEGTAAFLPDQTADSRVWPTDDQLTEDVPKSKLYGNIRQNRLCIVLSAVEQKRRSARNEDVTLPVNLQIEHVMPQKWHTHWSDGIVNDPDASANRDRLVQTIGNLTLLTGSLNASLSNRPWLDRDAAVAAPSGPEAGKGKRSLIDKYSPRAQQGDRPGTRGGVDRAGHHRSRPGDRQGHRGDLAPGMTAQGAHAPTFR